MVFRVIAAALLGLSSTAASANWTYTHWGESPDEVLSASKGTAVVSKEDQRIDGFDELVKVDSTWAEIPVTIEFYFTTSEPRKLQVVRLSPQKVDDCGRLRQSIIDRLGAGKPAQLEADLAKFGDELMWNDEAGGNFVTSTDVKAGDVHFCPVRFKPL